MVPCLVCGRVASRDLKVKRMSFTDEIGKPSKPAIWLCGECSIDRFRLAEAMRRARTGDGR
jgi:hypothetical protein